MKKFVAVLSAAAMMTSLAACGSTADTTSTAASSSAAVGAVALDLRSRFGRVHKAVAAFRQRQPLAGDVFIRRRAAPDGLHVHFSPEYPGWRPPGRGRG